MKKYIKQFFVMFMLVGAFFMCNVKAEYTSFGGSANYYYSTISGPNAKADTADHAYLIWSYSNATSSHKEWFQIVNSNNEYRGKGIFNYLAQGYINTSGTVQGYWYYVQASRENIIDPSTYVSGSWES